MLLELMGVSCGYGSVPVLANATFSISQGDMLGIVGPNGSGKSTLLRTMSRVLPPRCGSVILQEEDIYKLPAREVARQVAYVSQETALDFPFTVAEVVMMGRIPHLKRFQKEGAKDREIVSRALELTGTTHLAERPVTELSGGERQRVLISRALAQEPRVLFLDEPTSFLDINYQIEILELLTHLRHERELTVVMSIHDLNLASQFCSSLLVLKGGSIFAAGPPDQVITAELIYEVYGCSVRVENHHPGGRPTVMFQPVSRPAGSQSHGSVHVVGGGGSSIAIFNYLSEKGWTVSAGVINIGDFDWREAVSMGFEIVEAAPFCEITSREKMRNRELMRAADYVVLSSIPFGPGNLPNLEAVLEAAQDGSRVIVIDKQDISRRDYTNGQASALYRSLLASGASVAGNEREALAIMEGGIIDAGERQNNPDHRGGSQRKE